MMPSDPNTDCNAERPKLLLSLIDSLYISYFIDGHSGPLDFVEATLLENVGIPEGVAADIIGHDKTTMTYGL
jgi:hypothetical protein